MKVLIGLIVLVYSSLSFSDTVYVRKSVTDSGVSFSEGEKVRQSLQDTVISQGHKVMTSPKAAQWNLRAVVGKTTEGLFTVKVEKFHNGKALASNHGSDVKLDQATKLATANLVDSINKSLPEKTSAVTSSTPVAAEGAANYETREVATTPEEKAASVEAKHPNYIKNWIAAVGPVVSNSLVGTNGTKFAISLGYQFGISEHFNIQYMYDASFNTASVGGTASAIIAAGIKYYLSDRLSDFSPFAMIDVGFGGGNRANDATGTVGGTIGVDVYRTQPATFMVYLRNYTMATNNGSSLSNYPNITQFMLGINF